MLMGACGLQAVMSEPVIATDGHTYDKAALQQWQKQHETSPVTGSLMHKLTIPNLAIKQLIRQEQVVMST